MIIALLFFIRKRFGGRDGVCKKSRFWTLVEIKTEMDDPWEESIIVPAQTVARSW